MEARSITRFTGLNEMIESFSGYKRVIGVGELKEMPFQEGKKRIFESDIRFSDAMLIIRGLEGRALVNLDYTPYEIGAETMLIVLPIHALQVVHTSPDFTGRLLVIQKSFIEECSPMNGYLSLSNYMTLRKNPFVSFLPGESIYLDKCLNEIKEKIELRNHAFHKEVIKNTLCAYILETAHLMEQHKITKSIPVLSRKEDLVNRFFQLIIRNCKVEHSTTFYADKLCITPQYLSSILKEMTGKPANYWISDALITEAKIELRKPQVTVQEVAYSLNFSDQSSFGKFFKKGIGLSPSQYRVSNVS
ncbi:helix-turn-helix transcriptional regulator [Parabacteroides sp. PF5-6]|uniref:helix-turn-helix domain-containing protein n=1 Tax=Parabacteroides sp. PF5-6 TaxID=1742403 RepID=UPI0024054EFE|nr:helix-turn-helix transcriptional regulator [Parabacteroides sp. PF5-6]MDF9830976.1 AraC family transcriptional activator of pobA [Parabacteroides sp. PF5-6]